MFFVTVTGHCLEQARPFLRPDCWCTHHYLATCRIYFIKQSEAKTDDDVTMNTLSCPLFNPNVNDHPLPYSASDLHVQFFIRLL
ncbi:hypothetical protein T4E_11103 [Trichinella pseudospiralis]|uniref:Uncharacterized protein n=1 Tax=Trichinella pseudospiralis TaxID=6337 RepID=A0A0V0YKG6_TRIPS|nr:hypothetical protein T4E_11103 [Trichinella pseudospiralis]